MLNTPLQFLGDSADTRRLGLGSGIADTALERLTVGADQCFNTISLFAAAAAAGIQILTINPAQMAALDSIAVPPAIKNVLTGELAQGHTLILPAQLVPFNNTRTFGWWSVDPASGMAMGKMELGGAQAMTETIEMHERIEKWTEIFAKFYGNLWKCYAMALAKNLGGLGALETGHLERDATAPDSKQLAACVIKAACDAIADLLAEAVTSAAFAKEASAEVESLKKIIAKWAAEFAHEKGLSYGYDKLCEQAAGVKD